jgi:hypothetical protein
MTKNIIAFLGAFLHFGTEPAAQRSDDKLISHFSCRKFI